MKPEEVDSECLCQETMSIRKVQGEAGTVI